MVTTPKLVILDRDGVINYESNAYVQSPEAWRPLPGSLRAIALFNQLGYSVVVATNQSGIGRGYFTEATLAQIHNKMHRSLKPYHGCIDRIFYCPHRPDEHCQCRKPAPGLLKKISQHYHVALQEQIFVGDSLCDIQVANAVNCKPYLVLTGNGQQTLAAAPWLTKTVSIFPDLLAVALKLSRTKR